jgi:hypothetical protein
MSDKMSPSPLQRAAAGSIRQATGSPARHPQERGRRHYALAERARALGCVQGLRIAAEGGRSGSGLQERPGCGPLWTAGGAGHLGAGWALEASRLARNHRAGPHLLARCALTDTLCLEPDGLYHPRPRTARGGLGLQGSLAAYALGVMRQRARHAWADTIRRGHCRGEVPVGCGRTDGDRIEKNPALQGPQAITGRWPKVRARGRARQGPWGGRDEQRPRPAVQPATAGRARLWRLPPGHRMQQIGRNPWYAGALAAGRPAAQRVLADGRARQTTRRKTPRDQGRMLRLAQQPRSLRGEAGLAFKCRVLR